MRRHFLPASRLDRQKLQLLPEALLALLAARLQVSLLPSSAYLSRPRQASALAVHDLETARRIAFVLEGLSLRLPWRSTCLVKALALRRMLGRRQISCTLHLGVHKNHPEQVLGAHAWISVEETILIGGGRMDRYAEIARFG